MEDGPEKDLALVDAVRQTQAALLDACERTFFLDLFLDSTPVKTSLPPGQLPCSRSHSRLNDANDTIQQMTMLTVRAPNPRLLTSASTIWASPASCPGEPNRRSHPSGPEEVAKGAPSPQGVTDQ
jgi:hypothetical protein